MLVAATGESFTSRSYGLSVNAKFFRSSLRKTRKIIVTRPLTSGTQTVDFLSFPLGCRAEIPHLVDRPRKPPQGSRASRSFETVFVGDNHLGSVGVNRISMKASIDRLHLRIFRKPIRRAELARTVRSQRRRTPRCTTPGKRSFARALLYLWKVGVDKYGQNHHNDYRKE